MVKTVSKGHANQLTLGDRMKIFESVTTNLSLMPKTPVYIRLDMRAGHSFCHGLNKPFDMDYVKTMQETTRYLVEKTGAIVGYCQSDEISLGYLDASKIPFETRLFKLESVIAGMASSFFTLYGLNTSLKSRIEKYVPTFDCRVLNMPSQEELANMFLWRELDCYKNSVTMAALSYFSDKQLHKKNTDEKIRMMRDEKNVDYFTHFDECLRLGSYFRRELYNKVLTDEELEKIPANYLQKIEKNADGKYEVIRSRITRFSNGLPLMRIANKVDVLFKSAIPIERT